PPATLWLTEVAITDHVDNERRSPYAPVTRLDRETLAKGLYAFTAIHAPRGLDERIYHVWYRDNEELDRIPLDITGGREQGYRAWTHKQNFPDPLDGDWKIRVVTAADQLIGELRFQVSPASGSVKQISSSSGQPEELGIQPSQDEHNPQPAVKPAP
ncbi:MAG TPA: DUF5924 family protein, partial [Xanthomonadales bacterium]|nr:DUF5924 family protein [Xanthomonadales bacterium]